MTLSLIAGQEKGRSSNHESILHGLVLTMAQRGPQSEPALARLYDLTVQRVAAIIGRFVTDRSTVAELTQDVFFQAWNQADRYSAERGCVLAWLLIIARSRALDAQRRRSLQAIVFDSDIADAMLEMVAVGQASGVEALELNQERSLIQHAVLALTPTARHILALAYFSGLSHAEISVHLQLPLGTIKSTLRRSLISLRMELEQLAPGIGLQFGLPAVAD